MYEKIQLAQCQLCQERLFVRGLERGIDAPVPPEGLETALVAVIGRNPGKQEALRGRPFIGPAGGKLDKLFMKVGLQRRLTWVTNVAKCFTPAEVKPSQKCLRVCASKWLAQELATLSLNKLKLIITCGDEALKYFEKEAYVGMLHGTSFFTPKPWMQASRIEVFVLYHPSAALRSSRINDFFLKSDAEALKQRLQELEIY